jgi:chorismate--pyruvate lyase
MVTECMLPALWACLADRARGAGLPAAHHAHAAHARESAGPLDHLASRAHGVHPTPHAADAALHESKAAPRAPHARGEGT